MGDVGVSGAGSVLMPFQRSQIAGINRAPQESTASEATYTRAARFDRAPLIRSTGFR